VLGLLVPVGIYMFYVLIEAWCLGYAWFYLSGTMAQLGEAARQSAVEGRAAAEALVAAGQEVPPELAGYLGSGAAATLDRGMYGGLLGDFVGMGENGAALQLSARSALPFLAICFVLNFLLIYRGLTRGIEKFCLWAMPLLVVCAVIVLIRVLTLDGILTGLGFMWNPRVGDEGLARSLLNGKMWLDATGQIFFSLSVGFGIIITYSSYLRRDDDVALSSLTSCAGNEFCEVGLGGMITIPAAFIFFGAAVWAGSSFGLGFVTLPMVFELMPFGYVVGFAFFFLLFLAAITSSLSMLQPAIALLEEGLGLNRKASVAMLGFITLIGAMFVLYFSKDTLALDTFDFWVGTFFIFVVATIQTILFGWVLGTQRGMEELDRGAEIRVPRIIGWLLKYVAPVYLTLIFVFWIYTEVQKPAGKNLLLTTVTNPVALLSVSFLALVAILFVLIIAQSVKRWDAADAARAAQGKEVR
jgi:neurotransmitter:Na+ symporter, NSS family